MSEPGQLGPCFPGDKSAIAPAIGGIVLGLGTLLLAARLYLRLRVVEKGYGWDDTTIILGWAFCVLGYVSDCVAVPYGFGRHAGCTTPENISKVVEYLFISTIGIVLSTAFSRISICIFLYRLFSTRLTWRLTLWTIGVVGGVVNFATVVVNLSQCTPVAKNWNPSLAGHCASPHLQVYFGDFQGAVSALIDILLSLLPIYFLWNVQISNRIKLGICALMGLGFLTATCVIARCIYLAELKGADVTWGAVDVVIWADLEGAISIVVANVPAVCGLFIGRARRERRPVKMYSEGDQRLVDAMGNHHAHDQSVTSLSSTRRQGTYTTAEACEPSDEEMAMEPVGGGIRKKVEVKISASTVAPRRH